MPKTGNKQLVVITTEDAYINYAQALKAKGLDDKAIIAEANKVIQTWLKEAGKITVIDQQSLEVADNMAKQLKKVRLVITGKLEPEVKEIYKDYKDKKAILDGYCNPMKAVEDRLRNAILAHQRKMAEIARKAAEEAKKKAEEEARKERERLQKEAEEAAKEGDEQKFEELAAKAEEVDEHDFTPVRQPQYMPPKGTSIKEKWKAEVTDFMALVKAVAEGKAPVDCLMVNQVYLNQRARSDKKNLKIPGVHVFDEGSLSMRTAA